MLDRTWQHLAISLLATVMGPASLIAQLGIQQDSERIVLLTNGNVLSGRVETFGQQVVVWTESGSRLVLPHHQVDAVFQSLSGAYQYQRERIAPNAVIDHVKLFEWCLRFQLWDEAQSQIDKLQFQSISRVELWRMSEALGLAKESAARAKAGNSLASDARALEAHTPPPITSNPQPFTTILPVTYVELPRDGQRLLPAVELNDLVSRIEPELLLRYEKHVDSIFVRNCATSGCHDSRNTTLAWLHVPRGTETPRLMKLQNLIRTVQHWSREPGEQHPLLRAAIQPHAGRASPIMSRDSVDYRTLELWIAEMADRPTAAKLVGIDLTPREAPPEAIVFPPRTPTHPRDRASSGIPRIESVGNSSSNELPANTLPRATKLEQDPNTFSPRDIFDPEIFNRFYYPRPKSVLPVPSSATGRNN